MLWPSWMEWVLREDLDGGDPTTEALIPATLWARGEVRVRTAGVVCGAPFAVQLLHRVDPRVKVEVHVAEGTQVKPDTVWMTWRGPARALLMAERTVLNLLARLSGIATLTRQYVERAKIFGVEVLDTRKTLPGYRTLEKYATRIGGARNHRQDLSAGIMIKDNHLALLGGDVARAVRLARQRVPFLSLVEVEVETLEQAQQAAEAGADVLLLDNMTPDQVAEVVRHLGGRVRLEVSGGITLNSIEDYARTGIRYISVGRITHAAPALDLSLDLQPEGDHG